MEAKGKPLTQAVAARVKNCAARRASGLREEFGELSPREVKIVQRVDAAAYERGYSRAMMPIRAKRTA